MVRYKSSIPKKITTKPLSPKDQDDRIRMIFGLTSNDPLPEVDDEKLLQYHQYLATNLAFPFQAKCRSEYGHAERVKVIGLGDPDEEPMIDEEYGLLCEVRLEGQVVDSASRGIRRCEGEAQSATRRGLLLLVPQLEVACGQNCGEETG